MEKFGILDLINKIQSLTSGQNENNAESPRHNDNTVGETKTDEPLGQSRTKNDDDQKSFMRTYNPFGAINASKPQVTSPKVKKLSKSTIDLKNSKNLAGDKSTDNGANMVQLISRHNLLAQKIKSHK